MEFMYCLCLSGVCRVEVGIIVPIEDDLYLPLCVLLSTQILSCPHSVHREQDWQLCSAPHTWRSVINLMTTVIFRYSLVLQTRPFPFHSTNGFQYWSHTESNWGCGTERQGVVTSKSPVEAFASGNGKKNVLDHLKLLITWFFYESKIRLQLCILCPLILAVWRWPWSLDQLSLITLFPVANSSTRITQVAIPLERFWLSLVPSRPI